MTFRNQTLTDNYGHLVISRRETGDFRIASCCANLKINYSSNSTSFPSAVSASIYNRSAATGKINFWPSNYSPSGNSIFDETDTGSDTYNGYGSFSVELSVY